MKNLPFANSDKVKADLAKGNVVAKNAQKFKWQVKDSKIAYLFLPVNNTNLFLKISDL